MNHVCPYQVLCYSYTEKLNLITYYMRPGCDAIAATFCSAAKNLIDHFSM